MFSFSKNRLKLLFKLLERMRLSKWEKKGMIFPCYSSENLVLVQLIGMTLTWKKCWHKLNMNIWIGMVILVLWFVIITFLSVATWAQKRKRTWSKWRKWRPHSTIWNKSVRGITLLLEQILTHSWQQQDWTHFTHFQTWKRPSLQERNVHSCSPNSIKQTRSMRSVKIRCFQR